MTQEKYEQAIKETFEFLDKCVADQPKKGTLEHLYNLGIDKAFIIKNTMMTKGFLVTTHVLTDKKIIAVIPVTHNLPSHLWKEK